MWEVEKIINSKNAFIGVLSSNYGSEERKPFKKHIESYFNNGGGMVYICSRDDEEQCINYLGNIWELDLNLLIKTGKLMFINRDNFLLEDNIDLERFLGAIEMGLTLLDNKGSNKNQVYITLDYFWNSMENDNVEYIYRTFKSMNAMGKTGFILKYIIEEFNRNFINYMLDNHDFILVDRVNDFDYYTSTQLAHESLALLAKYHAVDERYKKAMIRNEYLETLGELMESTVHDINNLLVTILGYAQLSLYLQDPGEIKEYLEIIAKTALDGKSITDKIKNHTKGIYESLKEIYEFDYIINNSIEMIKHKFKRFGSDNNSMKLVVDLNSKSHIYANEYDIRHSVINIILNGIDAMDNNGVLTVKTYDDEEHAVLEISDTGKGMDEGTKNKIFDSYFTTKGSKGTGLGLSIAKKIFHKHNGKVYVESKLGEGTKFTIYFSSMSIKDDIARV